MLPLCKKTKIKFEWVVNLTPIWEFLVHTVEFLRRQFDLVRTMSLPTLLTLGSHYLLPSSCSTVNSAGLLALDNSALILAAIFVSKDEDAAVYKHRILKYR